MQLPKGGWRERSAQNYFLPGFTFNLIIKKNNKFKHQLQLWTVQYYER